MHTLIRQKRPNFRIPYFTPPNAAPCRVPTGANAPFPPQLNLDHILRYLHRGSKYRNALNTQLFPPHIISSSSLLLHVTYRLHYCCCWCLPNGNVKLSHTNRKHFTDGDPMAFLIVKMGNKNHKTSHSLCTTWTPSNTAMPRPTARTTPNDSSDG